MVPEIYALLNFEQGYNKKTAPNWSGYSS